MNSQPACGKCPHCGDQLLTVPVASEGALSQVICPICVTRERDEMRSLLTTTTAGLSLWKRYQSHKYIATLEEDERMKNDGESTHEYNR